MNGYLDKTRLGRRRFSTLTEDVGSQVNRKARHPSHILIR